MANKVKKHEPNKITNKECTQCFVQNAERVLD